MPGGDRLASRLSAGNQPTFLRRHSRIVTRATHFPPMPQQTKHLVRQHHIAVLTALRLLDANDILCPVDMLDLEPHDLARPQSTAIADPEQNARLETDRDRQQSLDLSDAHHQRKPLWLTNVIDLLRKVQSPQRHPEQEPQPSHDAVAGANTHVRFCQVQLEAADILKGRGIRGSLQKCREPLAAADVASLRTRAELARGHILDHTLTQRGDSLGCHRQLLSWMRLTTPRSSRQGASPATHNLFPGDSPQDEPHLATIAKRFSALAQSASSRQRSG